MKTIEDLMDEFKKDFLDAGGEYSQNISFVEFEYYSKILEMFEALNRKVDIIRDDLWEEVLPTR